MRGISNEKKRRSIFLHCRERADIALLQEVHSVEKNEIPWSNEWGGKILFNHGSVSARGVCVLINKKFDCKPMVRLKDTEGRLLILEVKINEQLITLINVYAPNADRPQFFRKIKSELHGLCPDKIIMGDFNLVLDVDKDRLNTYSNNNNSRQVVLDIMNEYMLEDVWRVQNPEETQYTWIKTEKANTNREIKASRIDFALVSKGLVVEQSTFCPAVQTDHRTVYLSVKSERMKRGKGYWKFNVSLLRDADFLKFMNNCLEEKIQSSDGLSIHSCWEVIKKYIMKQTQAYSRNKQNMKKIAISQLMEKIDDYQQNLPLPEDEMKMLINSQEDLDRLQMEYIEGVMFRSKAKWYLEGEKGSKYFLNLEKIRYNSKTISLLRHNDIEYTDHDQIMQAQFEFYKELYTSDKSVKFEYVNKTDIRISDEWNGILNEPFMSNEIKNAVMKMQNNKTPGKDGIPIDFYKIFWNKLGDLILEMISESYSEGSLPASLRLGVLNLIPKPGKDHRYLKNLRPITLLNADYKIIEKVISIRLKKVLDQVISKDQTGFMSNRRISANIRKVLDLIQYTDKEQKAAFLMSCDFLKCFDRVEFTCVESSMRYFNLPEYMIKWVKILYNDFRLMIQNNGYFTQEMNVTRSIHQGGCCSAELFLLCAEILAINLKESDVKGVLIQQIEHLLNQFADDIDVASLYEQSSMDAIERTFDNFRQNSGFTLSYDKTTVYRLGSIKNTNAMLYTQRPLTWTNDSTTVLGIKIHGDDEELLRINYSPIIDKMRGILNSWENRNLSLFGKICVINSLVASLFVYKMTVLPSLTNKMIRMIEDNWNKFIWNNKKVKIPLRILQLPKSGGGAGLANLRLKEKALKIGWINIIESDNIVQSYAHYFLDSDIGQDIWHCNLNVADVQKIFPKTFWRDVLEAWSECSYNRNPFRQQALWYNSRIRIADKPIFWKNPYQRGLMWVGQVLTEDGKILEQDLKQIYGLNFLQIHTLLRAIPNEYKEYPMTNDQGEATLSWYERCLQTSNLTATMYKSLVDFEDQNIYNKVEKWRVEMGSDVFSYEAFIQSCNRIYVTTNVPKLRSFQFRLLHRAIITNVHLFRWKIRSNNLCSFCEIHKETYEHLFMQCQKVKSVWDFVIDYMMRYNQAECSLTFENIICNTIAKPIRNVKNLVCLLLKQFIYRQRCLGHDLSVYDFQRELTKTQHLEKYLACVNNNFTHYVRKWEGESFVDTYLTNV